MQQANQNKSIHGKGPDESIEVIASSRLFRDDSKSNNRP